MQREQAKAQLARLMVAQMAPSERAEVVAFWFFCGFCEGDPQVAALPDTLRALVCRGVEPANPNDSQLDPLVQASLVEDLYGVTNSYLREALSERGMIVQQVDGEAEPMFPCPCCDYFSLSSEILTSPLSFAAGNSGKTTYVSLACMCSLLAYVGGGCVRVRLQWAVAFQLDSVVCTRQSFVGHRGP